MPPRQAGADSTISTYENRSSKYQISRFRLETLSTSNFKTVNTADCTKQGVTVIKQPGLPKVTPVEGYVSTYYWKLPDEARVAGHAYSPSYLGEAAYLNANAESEVQHSKRDSAEHTGGKH